MAVVVRAAPAWNEQHVRSPSVLYGYGLALVAYEGWQNGVVQGIGLDIGREKWIEPGSERLDFQAAFGEPAAPQTLAIRNTGIGELTITQILLVGKGFSLAGQATPVTIGPNGYGFWEVSFTAVEIGTYAAAVLVWSDDALLRLVEINLTGKIVQ